MKKIGFEIIKNSVLLISFIFLIDAIYDFDKDNASFFWSSTYIFAMPFWLDTLSILWDEEWKEHPFIVLLKVVSGAIVFTISILGFIFSLDMCFAFLVLFCSGLFLLIDIITLFFNLFKLVKYQQYKRKS